MVSNYQGHLQDPVRVAYPRVSEFMSKSYLKISPELDIYQAMSLILKRKVSAAIVVGSDDLLVGIVSEKDLLKLATQDTYSSEPIGGPVSEYMTKEVESVTSQQGLNEVADLFINNPYRQIPVLDEGKIVGVVDRRGLLLVIEEFYHRRMKFLRQP